MERLWGWKTGRRKATGSTSSRRSSTLTRASMFQSTRPYRGDQIPSVCLCAFQANQLATTARTTAAARPARVRCTTRRACWASRFLRLRLTLQSLFSLGERGLSHRLGLGDLAQPLRLGALSPDLLSLARLDEVQLHRCRLRSAFRPALDPILCRGNIGAGEEPVCGSAACTRSRAADSVCVPAASRDRCSALS
jgi:hypothetical protein